MKITFDKKNKRTIANGIYMGKPIKAIAVCGEDTFDEEFASELVTKRYKLKKYERRMNIHEKRVAMYERLIELAKIQMREEQKIVDSMLLNLRKKEDNIQEFVDNHFA